MGRFLGETLLGETLSPRAEKQRAALLKRLQLHFRRSRGDAKPVPKIKTQKTERNGTNGSNLKEDDVELEAHTDCSPSPSSSSGRSEDSCKVNVSFSELKSTALKHGPLQRKEKGVFSDQWCKYSTVLHRHFLCMYSSEQGVKPCASANIQGFIARPVPNPKNEPIFETVCPGKTSYQVCRCLEQREHQKENYICTEVTVTGMHQQTLVHLSAETKFKARTVKDMNQWVATICQASVQYIQDSHFLMTNVTTDKSVSRRVQDVPAPADNEGEIYDYAGSVMNFNENPELQLYDELLYDDILNVHQGNARLESKPDCEMQPEEKCPPLPPRRPPLSVAQDDLLDQESVYDDIGVSEQHSQYSNVVGADGVGRKNPEIQTDTISKWTHTGVQPGTGTEEGHKTLQPSTVKEGRHTKVQAGTDSVHTMPKSQPSAKHKMQNSAKEKIDECREGMYVDMQLSDESPKTIKSPALQNKYSITNGGGIKNRAKALEQTLFKDGYQPKPKASNQTELNRSTLHKSMKNNGKDTLFSLPQFPTAAQTSKSDIFDQPLQLKSDLYKPDKIAEKETTVPSSNTPFRPQPAKPPLRTYLKK